MSTHLSRMQTTSFADTAHDPVKRVRVIDLLARTVA
jgi:hypothetical protein